MIEYNLACFGLNLLLALQAAANAANNQGANKNDLVVSQAYVNEAGFLKRLGVGYKGR